MATGPDAKPRLTTADLIAVFDRLAAQQRRMIELSEWQAGELERITWRLTWIAWPFITAAIVGGAWIVLMLMAAGAHR